MVKHGLSSCSIACWLQQGAGVGGFFIKDSSRQLCELASNISQVTLFIPPIWGKSTGFELAIINNLTTIFIDSLADDLYATQAYRVLDALTFMDFLSVPATIPFRI